MRKRQLKTGWGGGVMVVYGKGKRLGGDFGDIEEQTKCKKNRERAIERKGN